MTAYVTFANDPSTTVSAGGTDAPSSGTSQTWTVASSAGFPSAVTGTSLFHIGDPATSTTASELIAVTNISGTSWTVTRGAEGTTPVAHSAGFTVQQVVSAGDLGSFAQTGQGDLGGSGSTPTVTATHLSAALPIAQGGTGSATQQAALDALAGAVTANQVLKGNGTHVTLSALAAADLPAATSGAQGAVQLTNDLGGTATAPTVVGTHLASALPIAQGGTGSASRNFMGLLTPTAVKTGAYNSVAGDYVPCDTSSTAFTITLPAAPADLTVIGAKIVTLGGSNAVTIAAGGSDVFNKTGGSATLTLSLLFQGVILQYKATGGIWYVYADDLALAQLDARYVAQSSLPLAIGSGGTGQASAAAAYNALSPMTTTGDIEYESGASTASRLAGNTSATKKFLTQTGNGSVSAAPGWNTIVAGDLPTGTTSTQGALQLDGTATDIVAIGTQAAGAIGKAADAGHVHPGSFTATAYVAPAVFTLTFTGGGTTAVDASKGNSFALTLTASTSTLGSPSNSVDGQVIRIRMIQDATGSRTIAYNAVYDFGATGAPTLSTGVNKVDILGFEYVASLTKWCYLGSGLGF